MRERRLREIFAKTEGHCHFCGDKLTFDNRGWVDKPDGHWEVDHVIQRNKGGSKEAENCLAACTVCNRRRWDRTGDAMRELLLLGVIATDEIKNHTTLGMELIRIRTARLIKNEGRRIVRQDFTTTKIGTRSE